MQILLDENKHLEFTFNDEQEVLQYDQSRFYRNKLQHSNSWIKAADFLCRDECLQQSFLIEVKDYWQLEGRDAQEHKKETAEKLATTISQKVFETISGLFIATFSPHCDDEEREFASLFINFPLRVVFHYELPAQWSEDMRKQRMADMKQKLKRKLRVIDSSLQVEDITTANKWSVRRIPPR